MTTTTQRSDGTGDGDHPSVMSADGCTAPTALTGNRTNGHAGYRAGPSSGGPRTPGQDTPSAGKHTPRSTDSSHTDDEGAAGVEIRVHGIGDHATFSALGTPNYKELVDSRVWIGRVPPVPPHKLRLVNWSRANRKLTRHLSWYLAFPFTLLNVAGYMEPKAKVPRYVMRVGIGVASLCLTIAMAAWITVILETAWRALTDTDDRLTGVVLQAVGPCLLIVFIVYRMIVGRVLVDKGGTLISVFNILALVGMIRYLHSKPASRTGGPLGWYLVDTGSPQNTIDPMTTIVGYTTVIVWCVALFLCLFAIRMRRAGAGFAGAAVLLVLAVSLLHAAGSTLRLFTASLFGLVSSSADRVVHSAPSTRGGEVSIGNVLLPKADQLNSAGHQFVVSLGKALRIDLIPIFFIVMIVVFGGLLWIRLWWRRWDRNAAASEVTDQQSRSGRPKKETQPVSKIHFLVERLPARLAYAVVVAILATAGVWGLMIVGFRVASTRFVDDLMVGLQILGAVAIAMVVLRRPQNVAERLRRTFGAVADIAGFWAPDLHPLAGALLLARTPVRNPPGNQRPGAGLSGRADRVGRPQPGLRGVRLVRSGRTLDGASRRRDDRPRSAEKEDVRGEPGPVDTDRVVHLRVSVALVVRHLLPAVLRRRLLPDDATHGLPIPVAQLLAQNGSHRHRAARAPSTRQCECNRVEGRRDGRTQRVLA